MKANIYHWFSGENQEDVHIKNLEKWIKKHNGAVVVRPPSINNHGKWQLYITDSTNRFNQR